MKAKVKPGSKQETIYLLLTRKAGCTLQDVLDATGWAGVSIPRAAKQLGLKLKTVKQSGVTRYSAAKQDDPKADILTALETIKEAVDRLP